MKGNITMKHLFALMMVVLLSSLNLYAQSTTSARESLTVTGTVFSSDGEPLVGATVIEQGVNNGVTTDLKGEFSLTLVGNGRKLTVSFMSYETQTINLGARSHIDVVLESDIKQLDEVVVVGYGVQSKKDLTGAISVVKASDMENIPVVDFGSAIAGRTSGVQVLSSSGKPGSGFSIQIRGASSINASSEPLYILDGVPTTDTQNINPADIESISILKDASSAAIYGSAGANGVVIITTKRGRSGEANVQLNIQRALSLPPSEVDVLNTEQYNELLTELGYPAYDTDVYNANINWQDEMYDVANMSTYQVSISGGDDRGSYYVSGSVVDQEGIIAPSSYKRYSLRVNADNMVKNWLKVGTNISYSHTDDVTISEGSSTDVMLSCIATPSVVDRYDEDGTFMTLPFLSSMENPYSGVYDYTKDYFKDNIYATAYAELDLAAGLKFKSSFGITVSSSRYKEFLDPFMSDWGLNQEGEATYNSGFSNSWINENTLAYNKEVNNHRYSLLGGFVLSETQSEGANVSVNGFSSNKLTTLNAGTTLSAPSEYYDAYSNASVLLRSTYDYNSKYLATLNFRADGSSKFGSENRWGYFPSFSLGWRINSEDFMSSATWVDDLKLRTGWGIVGNDGVGSYSSYGIYGVGANYNIDGDILSGYYQSQIGNNELRWEKTSQINIGADFTAYKGRLSATLDVYNKTTTDLLLMVSLPESSGFDSGMQNIGEVSNKGIEFQVSTVNIDRAVKWRTDITLSKNINEVIDMGSTPAIYTGGLDKKISGYTSIVTEGEALGTFYGYKAHGVNVENGRMMYENAEGRLVYEEDLSEDADRVVIGNAQAKLLYGISNVVTWKNLELSIFLQGSYGNDVFNASRMFTEGMFDSRNQSTAVLDRWQNPGDYTSMPRAEKDLYPIISSRFVEDGSYLKIKTLKLSYSLPSSLLSRINITQAMIYFAAENLYTFTNYSGTDPELNIAGSSATAMGIDQGGYPHAQVLSIGAVISF